MTTHLCISINNLRQGYHEISIGIDSNEANNKLKNGVEILLQLTKLIDVISQKYGICKAHHSYMRDRQRIEFLFYSESFLDTFDTTPFNEVTTSDHNELLFDLRFKAFFLNSYITLPDYTSRPLKFSNTQSVVNYQNIFATISLNTTS